MKGKILGLLILAMLFGGCRDQNAAEKPVTYDERTSAVVFENPPEDVPIPEFYFGHDFPWIPFRIYMYTDHQGEVQYRAYGRGKEGSGFYNVSLLIQNDSALELAEEERIRYTVPMEEPGLGRIAPVPRGISVPSGWRRVSSHKPLWEVPYGNGRSLYRIWAEFPAEEGRRGNFYPATADGRMLLGGIPDVLNIGDYQVVIKRTGIPENLHRPGEVMSLTEINEEIKAHDNLEARLLEERLSQEKIRAREQETFQAQEKPDSHRKPSGAVVPQYYEENHYSYDPYIPYRGDGSTPSGIDPEAWEWVEEYVKSLD